jgi:Domain of unknown function (DUF4186)
MPESLDQRLDTIARRPFRAKFHLRGRDRTTAQLNGPATIRRHADDLIAKRLAPAEPYKRRQADSLPRPPRVRRPARHRHLLPYLPPALARDPKGRVLSPEERAYVVDVIFRWIQREMAGSPETG